jgi:hypothetical protein
MRTTAYALVLFFIIACGDTTTQARGYKNLTVIDVHNHDSYKYKQSLSVWNKYHIDKIVLFGAISEPRAVETDRMAWEAYTAYPERFYPFFAGFDVHDKSCLETVKNN